jgi:branched-chain amino acid transport system substrate-binding protein
MHRAWKPASAALALLLTAAAAGCGSGGGSSTASGSSSGGTITIGFNDSLTGSDAPSGTANLMLAKAAIAYVNAQGGIDGKKLKLVPLDSGQIGSGAAGTNATELAQDHAAAMLGPNVSNDCDEAQPIVTENKIPAFCGYLDRASLVPVQPYIFQADVTELAFAAPMIDLVKKATGNAHPTIAVVTNFTQGATQWAQKLQAIAPALGAKVVYTGTESQTATDLTPLGAGVIASHPDAVLAEIFQPFVVPTIRQLTGAGLKVPFIAMNGVMTYSEMQSANQPNVYEIGGGNFIIPGAAGNSAQLKQLVTDLAAAGGTTPATIDGASGTDPLVSFLDLFQAMKDCHACTGQALISQLEKTTYSFPGLAQGFSYSSSVHMGFKTFTAYQWDPSTHTAAQIPGTIPAGTINLTSP